MILIAFTGRMGSGKSTAAKVLEKLGFKRFSFAAKLKELAEDLFEMKDKDRKLLQDFGASMRDIQKDVWAKYLIRKIELYVLQQTVNKGSIRIVVDDLRYLNEAAILRENGFVLVRLIALNEEARFNWLRKHETLEGENHSSETEQDLIPVDYTIQWGSLEDLEMNVLSLVAELVLKEPKTSMFDVKKNKAELMQFVVDECVAKIKSPDTPERDKQRYIRILNECLKTMTRLKELDQITEDDLAQILKRLPKKLRL